MVNKLKATREFPVTRAIGRKDITFRLMRKGDKSAVLAFARSLPENDIAFLRMDITRPKILSEWISNIEAERTVTVLAIVDKRVVGYGSLHHNEMLWTRHMGEIRTLVGAEFRGSGELQQFLANEIFQIAKERKLMRVIAQIPTDQSSISKLYQHLGFKAEALLTDWIMTHDNLTHDIVVMSMFLDD